MALDTYLDAITTIEENPLIVTLIFASVPATLVKCVVGFQYIFGDAANLTFQACQCPCRFFRMLVSV